MLPVKDLFLREDLSKPENRINVALFGLMTQGWFREWFLKKLSLPSDVVVYPPKTYKGYRPDLKAVSDDSTLAWIEVELGADEAQAKCYEKEYCESVKRVWGKRSDACDLSLEEIADRLDNQKDLPKQTQVNVDYLRELIREGLAGHIGSPGRATVSDDMRSGPLVAELSQRLGDRLLFDIGSGSPRVGYLKADTTDTHNNKGFSLRVRRRDSSSGTVSLMAIKAETQLIFPSRQKLNRCLPDRQSEVEAYLRLVSHFGCDVDVQGDNAKPSLRLNEILDTVLEKIDEIACCAKALAE